MKVISKHSFTVLFLSALSLNVISGQHTEADQTLGSNLEMLENKWGSNKPTTVAHEENFFEYVDFSKQSALLSDPKNTVVINGLYMAFGEGDIPTVLAAMDEKIVWNEAEGNKYADGNPYIGPNAVLEGVFARIGAEYEYFKLKDIQLHDMASNKVLATLRYEGQLKKNGAPIDAQAAHLWTLRDGKIIAFQQYVDTRQLAEAENK